jgi:aryl-alcohol dehydrogenase-like predicted oxidoreductase
MTIRGHATTAGTAAFRDRFNSRMPGHVRQARDLWLASVGIGTYLGEPTPAQDERYQESVCCAIEHGINVIDSAVNYRHQRSERAIGAALRSAVAGGQASRDQLFVCTKGGFLSFDGQEPQDPAAYFYEKVIRSGLAREQDVAMGCHVMTPGYLRAQVAASLSNLGLECVDLYYLHNPETQMEAFGAPEFYVRLRKAFAALEDEVAQGRIRTYGTATWKAFRVSAESPGAVSLKEVVRIAREVGGDNHHFRALQLPFNLAMIEALGKKTQGSGNEAVTVLRLAQDEGLMVFSSATLLQGKLSTGLPARIRQAIGAELNDAQSSIQFARSAPGITTALVGMSRREHVIENLGATAVPPLTAAQFQSLFSSGQP